jgi:tape measure domain-containing protein
MASEIRTGIKLTGDASGMNAAFVSGEKAVQKLNNEVDAASKHTRRLDGDMGSLAGGIGKVAAAVGGWQLGRVIIGAADDMTVLQSRLKLVTRGSNELAYVQERLYGIAQQNRVNFGDLGATYAQIARSAGDLGISQERLLGVTQTIGQTMAISGGSAQSMNAALVQLSQGLASGTLRGEELNSIMEQTPRLAQAIAQGMGVSLGQLRALGQDGKLTAQTVIEALEKSAPAIRREFDQVTPTISGSFVALKNSGALFVSQMDKATGSSAALSKGLASVAAKVSELARGIESSKSSINLIASGATWAIGLGSAAVALGRVALGVRAIGLALAAHPAIAALMLGGAAVGAWVQWGENKRNSLEGMKNQLKVLEKSVRERSIYEERTPENNAAFDKVVQKRLQAIEQLRAAIRTAEDTSAPGRRDFNSFERQQEDSQQSALMFPGAKPIDEVKKYAQLGVDIQREAYDKSVEIAKAYQNRIALATNDDERVSLTKEMNARLVQVDKDAKRELEALGKQGSDAAKARATEARQLGEAQLGEIKARMELTSSLERQDLAQRQRSNEQFYRLGLVDVDQYYERKAALASEDLDITARLLNAELAQAKALSASAANAQDKARAQARVLNLEKELVDIATQRQAVQAEPGNEADARRRERDNQLRQEVGADRVKNTQDAYAEMMRMDAEMRRIQTAGIRDPQARARAELEAELQLHRERLALIVNDNTREEAIDKFNDYAVAKQFELNERLKPAWQQMLDDWKDTSRLMRDAYNDTMESMLRGGEEEFVRSGGNLVSVASNMVTQLQQQLLRLIYKKYISGFVESLGGTFLDAILGSFGGAGAASANSSSAYSLTGGSGSSGLGLQMRAGGGSYGPGLVLRGENGPELSYENTGGYVFNSAETRQMLGGGSGGVGNLTITLVNQSGTALQATSQKATTGADGSMQVEVMVEAIASALGDQVANRSGPLSRGIESGYGLRPVTG